MDGPVGTTHCPHLQTFMPFRIQRGGYSPQTQVRALWPGGLRLQVQAFQAFLFHGLCKKVSALTPLLCPALPSSQGRALVPSALFPCPAWKQCPVTCSPENSMSRSGKAALSPLGKEEAFSCLALLGSPGTWLWQLPSPYSYLSPPWKCCPDTILTAFPL